MNVRALIVTAFVVCSATAFADANITVDGNPADWSTLTNNCFADTSGGSTKTVDVTNTCVENNNTAGDVGSLFLLIQNSSRGATGSQFGFGWDTTGDGTVTLYQDQVWYITMPASGPITSITRLNGTVSTTFNSTSSCGGTSTSDGWQAAYDANGNLEISISYGCLGWSYGTDQHLLQMGAYQPLDPGEPIYYDGTGDTATASGAPPEVLNFTLSAQPGKNVLTWSNPPEHMGVLILRATGAAVTGVPTNGTTYALNATLGNAKVVYTDGTGATASAVNSFTDSGLAVPNPNPTRYYYKVFNHWQSRMYARGNSPTSNGLFGEPTATSRPAGWNGPLWCYSTGFASFVQPAIRRGVGVYGAGQLAAVMGNNTDGSEKYRPQRLSGAVQDRYTVAATTGISSGLFTGDQSGRVYALDTTTGAALWTANGGSPLASSIQTTPVFQARQYSGAAFQSAFSTDVLFVASRNGSASSNRVFALRPDTGAVLWTGPKDATTGALVNMDIVSGAPWVDYDNQSRNRIWVGARTNGGSQPGLYVLDSLTGKIIKTFSLPGVDLPVFRDYTLNQMVVVDTSGTVHGYDLNTLNQVWTVALGGTAASFPYTVGGGFIITRKRTGTDSGQVMRYTITNNTPALAWSRNVPDPSYPTIDFTPGQQFVYVGGSDGKVYELDPANGNILKTLTANSVQVGTPGIDTLSNRLHVFGADGRLCAFQLPIN